MGRDSSSDCASACLVNSISHGVSSIDLTDHRPPSARSCIINHQPPSFSLIYFSFFFFSSFHFSSTTPPRGLTVSDIQITWNLAQSWSIDTSSSITDPPNTHLATIKRVRISIRKSASPVQGDRNLTHFAPQGLDARDSSTTDRACFGPVFGLFFFCSRDPQQPMKWFPSSISQPPRTATYLGFSRIDYTSCLSSRRPIGSLSPVARSLGFPQLEHARNPPLSLLPSFKNSAPRQLPSFRR